MRIPKWIREIKNEAHPPLWMRLIVGCHENWRHPLQRLRIPRYIAAVKESRGTDDIDSWIDLAADGLDHTIIPLQMKPEMRRLLLLLEQQRPKRLLEIGTLLGGTLFLFSRVAAEDATIVSIDLPYRGPGMGYPRWKMPLFEAFGWPDQRIHLIRGDSHASDTIEQLKLALGGASLDFLFIDGDHSYEGMREDFECYAPMVREGGIVVMDGIEPRRGKHGDTNLFWNDIKSQYRHEEIVDNRDAGWGIGVLHV